MRKFFVNITPVFVISLIGLILCVGEILILLLSKDQGELATGVLSIVALFLFAVLLFDRYLVTKIRLRKIIVGELIIFLLIPFLFMYLNKKTRIHIDTNEEYYILVYNENGLTKEQIPSKGLFNRGITIHNQTTINLHSSLLKDNEILVETLKGWRDGETNMYFDTTINSKKVTYQMFYHHLSSELADSIFRKNCHQH
jgi:hypothetical protein